MLLKFINREEELSFLAAQYLSKSPSLIVIYGRRRVGKTALINKFIETKPSFYFLCKRQNLSLELERFSAKYSEAFNVHLKSPRTFEELFIEILKKVDTKKKFIIAIDEFTYWIEEDKEILSTFQVIFDELLSKQNVMLILSGSTVSLMETEVLGYRSPLYGRRTGQWNVAPLSFFTLKEFFPGYLPEDLIKIYACTNGIPLYIQQFDSNKSFEENVNSTFYSKGNILYEEGEFLLMEELRQKEKYFNIIFAVSQGSTKLSEIASKSKIDVTNILKYLTVLMRLGIIKKIKPVTVRKEKTKQALFKVSDKFFKFWTMFVYPYKAEIERGMLNFHNFKNEFNLHLGSVFEEVCEEFLAEQNKKGLLPFNFTQIGKEWGKIPLKKKGENTYEIDIIALNDERREILFGECKWQENVDAKKILAELKEKSEHVQWNQGKRKEHYAVFAKSYKEKIKAPDLILFDLKDFQRLIDRR